MTFSNQAQNKCAATVRLTRELLAVFCYMTHPELGLLFGVFYFLRKKNKRGEKKCTEVASAWGEHPASAAEKRGIYRTVTRAHACADSLDTLGRCHVSAAPSSSQGGAPWLVSLPAA